MLEVLGLLSDSHGSLDTRALEIFKEHGVTRIIHAGDIGPLSLLKRLEEIAPVTAVLGNNDYNLAGSYLEERALLRVNGVRIAVVHRIEDVSALVPDLKGTDVVIVGHAHVPGAQRDPYNKVLYINPGSVTSPRRGSARTVALLTIADSSGADGSPAEGERVSYEFIALDGGAPVR